MSLPIRLKKTQETVDPTPTITLTKPPFTSTNLLDVLSLYPICDRLCSHLDISGLLLLNKISKSLFGNIGAHLKKRWDINRKLTRFVRDPERLRSLLGKYDALISGKPNFLMSLPLHVNFHGANYETVIQEVLLSSFWMVSHGKNQILISTSCQDLLLLNWVDISM